MPAARILPGLPPYGPPALSFPHPDAFREGLVVEFERSDGSRWTGNFAASSRPRDAAILTELGNRAVVLIADDVGYVVDSETQKLVHDLGWGIQEIWFVAELQAMVISRQGIWLEAFNADRTLWRSRRFSWDGLRNLEQSGLTLTGEAWAPGEARGSASDMWLPFRASLSTGEVEGGSWNGPED